MGTERAATEEEHAYIAREVPSFIEALAAVRAGESDAVIMTIGAFGAPEEAGLLHAALRVAYDQGVTVVFAPTA